MKKLSKEKREWLERNGFYQFNEPIEFGCGTNWFYSRKYIEETSLEKLKSKFDKRLILEGEPIIND